MPSSRDRYGSRTVSPGIEGLHRPATPLALAGIMNLDKAAPLLREMGDIDSMGGAEAGTTGFQTGFFHRPKVIKDIQSSPAGGDQ